MTKNSEKEMITVSDNSCDNKKDMVVQKKVKFPNIPSFNEMSAKKRISTNTNAELRIDYDYQLPENKKSLRDKPFIIVEPDRAPIIESLEKTKVIKPSKEEAKNLVSDFADSIVINEKNLKIEVIESYSIKVGTVFEINAGEMPKSNRNIKDGCIYFGSYSGDDPSKMNDVIISPEEDGFGKRHFAIEYDGINKKYYLKDLGDGSGTFMKVISRTQLKNNTIILFGCTHLLILFPPKMAKSSDEVNCNEDSKDEYKR